MAKDIVLAQVEGQPDLDALIVTEDGAAIGVTEGGEAVVLVDDHAEAPGMPQLNFETFPNQIFWLVVTLAAIYYLLSRVALPRIGAVLAERQGTITNDIAAAEDLRQKADEAEKAYDKALADARAESQRIAAEGRAEVQRDLDKAIAKADADIAARTAESEKEIAAIRDEAAASVEQVAREAAEEIVRVLGGNPEDADLESAVSERMRGVRV
ncbi:F0F1 ATP synthase subunit B' [Roseitranquillus sediminis]|uniref:F0F1 ATP synthase subunit B' n=1 Tax=Roseitranquillus sediminis TaxID=2809051 RepID=UPI001D0CB0BC|nr:F0F1 ATP synthase subunit B' [Roseitranquillus sediminis]MBM9594188.1 F0F1 ATP synthase subunit B' [Roseitranquillus sediminis]